MKSIAMAVMLVSLTGVAQAGFELRDRELVTKETINTVLDRGDDAFEKFRVYSSRTFKIKREGDQQNSTIVSDGIDRRNKKTVEREKVKRKLRGKVLHYELLRVLENQSHTFYRVWVSFDKKCQKKECSYIFDIFDTNSYLFAVPKRGKFPQKFKSRLVGAYYKVPYMNDDKQDFENHYKLKYDKNLGTGLKRVPKLEFKLSENNDLKRERVRNNGWD